MAFEKSYKYRTQRDNIELLRKTVESLKRAIVSGAVPNLTTVEALLTAIDGNTDGIESLIGTTNSTLNSILNSIIVSQDFEILLVRDNNNGGLVVKEIKEYDQGTGVWTTRYEDVDGNAYTPVAAPGTDLEYLDPSAVLNLMLTELLSIKTNTSDNATETTLSNIEGFIVIIDAVLDAIKLDTANLDVALSTRASEATLLNVEADTTEITEDLDKKARYYFDIFKDTFLQGTVVNSFPFTIDYFEYANALNFSRQYFPPSTVVNSTAEVVALWNATVPDAIMTVRDDTTIWFDPRQGVEWDYGDGGFAADTMVIGHLTGYGLLTWTGLTDPLIGPTYYGFYEDTILSESNLDWMLIELQRQSKKLATADKQDAIVSAINNQIDYEVVQCYGRDSAAYVPWTITPGSNTLTQYSAGAFPAPGEIINPSWDSYGLAQDNNAWYAEITIDRDFTAVDAVDVLLDAEYFAGLGNFGSLLIELIETAGNNVVATQSGFTTVPVGTTEAFALSYDNSSTNYPELKLRITPVAPGAPFGTITTSYDNFQVLDTALGDPVQAIIQRVDKYENNILMSTEYFDYLGAPYTLTGTFMKDASLQATSLLKEALGTIQTNTADIAKLVAHNTNTSFILPLGGLPTAYTGFKELTFAVLSGTADVQIGIGGLLTYPLAVASGGVIVGQTVTADDIDVSGVQVDPTLGDVLITIKT